MTNPGQSPPPLNSTTARHPSHRVPHDWPMLGCAGAGGFRPRRGGMALHRALVRTCAKCGCLCRRVAGKRGRAGVGAYKACGQCHARAAAGEHAVRVTAGCEPGSWPWPGSARPHKPPSHSTRRGGRQWGCLSIAEAPVPAKRGLRYLFKLLLFWPSGKSRVFRLSYVCRRTGAELEGSR